MQIKFKEIEYKKINTTTAIELWVKERKKNTLKKGECKKKK